MTEARTIFKDRNKMYALLETEKRELVLEVVCGGVGLSTMRVRLTPEEQERYAQEGKPFLDDLARQIARHQSAFRSREV